MKSLRITLLAVFFAALALPMTAAGKSKPAAENTVRAERNHIRSGNKLFEDKRYAEAEVEYGKALQVAPQSSVARFNLACALLHQGNAALQGKDKNDPVAKADSLFGIVAKQAADKGLRSRAFYNRGNIAYHREDYGAAVDHYKNSLRLNPDDNNARYNLRMAQLKLKDQQKNGGGKNNQQNQDKQQDQQKQDQQKQDQQNNDQQKQDQQNKEQEQPQNNQQQQPRPGEMSQQNAEQVLKTMQNQENATQQRLAGKEQQAQQAARARSRHKW